jgi:hypothetical protein
VKATVTPADGYGERDAALVMIAGLRGRHRVTVAADKGYDVRDFVAELRHMTVTPHIAQHTTRRRTAVDGRTTRHPDYAISQGKRKMEVTISACQEFCEPCVVRRLLDRDLWLENPALSAGRALARLRELALVEGEPTRPAPRRQHDDAVAGRAGGADHVVERVLDVGAREPKLPRQA